LNFAQNIAIFPSNLVPMSEPLLLFYGLVLFSVPCVIAATHHNPYFPLIVFFWWLQSVLAHFRAPEFIASHLIALFFFPSVLIFLGTVTGLALAWLFGTAAFPLLLADPWRLIITDRASGTMRVFRLTNWPSNVFAYALLVLAISFNFLHADFSPDLLGRQLSVVIGLLMVAWSLAAIVAVMIRWFRQRDRRTPRLNIVYALVLAFWIFLPPVVYFALLRFVLGRLLAVEGVLLLLLIATVFVEWPFISPQSSALDSDIDLRFYIASKATLGGNVRRFGVLLYLPLALVYLLATVASNIASLTFALTILVITLSFFVLLYTLVFTRTTTPAKSLPVTSSDAKAQQKRDETRQQAHEQQTKASNNNSGKLSKQRSHELEALAV